MFGRKSAFCKGRTHFVLAERRNSSQISSIQVFLFSPLISCSKYPISKFSPSSTEPPSDGINPKILFNSVVLPIPLAPTSAILCPRSMEMFNGFDSGSSYPITRSFVSKNIASQCSSEFEIKFRLRTPRRQAQ